MASIRVDRAEVRIVLRIRRAEQLEDLRALPPDAFQQIDGSLAQHRLLAYEIRHGFAPL